MPRTPRALPPEVPYHLTTRGSNKRPIFADDVDRLRFLESLGAVGERYAWSCLGYCLMGNHVHLIMSAEPGAVSQGMRDLLGRHSRAFNKRANRTGPLFGGRFHHVAISSDAQLAMTIKYVALNPVRAGLVERPEQWRWSSYSALLRDAIAPGTLDTAALFRLLIGPNATFRQGVNSIRALVEAGVKEADAAAAVDAAMARP